MKTLEDLLIETIHELDFMEIEITKALAKLIPQVNSSELKEALEKHSIETQNHVARLEQIENELGIGDSTKDDYKGIKGILEDGDTKVEKSDLQTRDSIIISSAQIVEHFEMAGYNTAIAYSKLLGYDKIKKLLEETLKEEIAADKKLATIAKKEVNKEALEK